ncbi:hypothetical protein OC846_004326 [Tilletia horrida]|uniref:Restriction of telomere capping protein 4 C-terminal domain-containing protein n=1 Tax=Tilletia horrida TaxID=155126 RepID=A0AAN6GNF8_9BASI|nr:hypothetical protein OC846_004326 [Tilletia horrida]KAK0564049.1 hypothetical protein OC861_004509 [Tilletia horrida]
MPFPPAALRPGQRPSNSMSVSSDWQVAKPTNHTYCGFTLDIDGTNESYFSIDNETTDDPALVNAALEPRNRRPLLECFSFALVTGGSDYTLLDSPAGVEKHVLLQVPRMTVTDWLLPTPAEMIVLKLKFVCLLCPASQHTLLSSLHQAKKHYRMHPVGASPVSTHGTDDEDVGESTEDSDAPLRHFGEPAEHWVDRKHGASAKYTIQDWENIANSRQWPLAVDWVQVRKTFDDKALELIEFLVRRPTASVMWSKCVRLALDCSRDWESHARVRLAHAGFYGPQGYEKILEWTNDYLNSLPTGLSEARVFPLSSVDAYIRYVMVPHIASVLIRKHMSDVGGFYSEQDEVQIWEESVAFGSWLRPVEKAAPDLRRGVTLLPTHSKKAAAVASSSSKKRKKPDLQTTNKPLLAIDANVETKRLRLGKETRDMRRKDAVAVAAVGPSQPRRGRSQGLTSGSGGSAALPSGGRKHPADGIDGSISSSIGDGSTVSVNGAGEDGVDHPSGSGSSIRSPGVELEQDEHDRLHVATAETTVEEVAQDAPSEEKEEDWDDDSDPEDDEAEMTVVEDEKQRRAQRRARAERKVARLDEHRSGIDAAQSRCRSLLDDMLLRGREAVKLSIAPDHAEIVEEVRREEEAASRLRELEREAENEQRKAAGMRVLHPVEMEESGAGTSTVTNEESSSNNLRPPTLLLPPDDEASGSKTSQPDDDDARSDISSRTERGRGRLSGISAANSAISEGGELELEPDLAEGEEEGLGGSGDERGQEAAGDIQSQ